MTQREINRAIYLSGQKFTGYTVHHNVEGESIVCQVASVDIGNTIVRALRERQKGESNIRQALRDLVEWAEYMGGWDASCWKKAKQALRH